MPRVRSMSFSGQVVVAAGVGCSNYPKNHTMSSTSGVVSLPALVQKAAVNVQLFFYCLCFYWTAVQELKLSYRNVGM